jgi:hypothetical protein
VQSGVKCVGAQSSSKVLRIELPAPR